MPLTTATAEEKTAVTKDMAYIPFGQFLMGSTTQANAPSEPSGKARTAKERLADSPQSWANFHDEGPAHPVVLDAYYLDKHEVSNRRYGEFMKATGHAAPAYWDDKRLNKPEQPVVGVNWYDAKAFCEFEGKRLPTEAEWEKAAKGPQGFRYPWGNEVDPARANYGGHGNQQAGTKPVGSYPNGVSGYGLHDMAGNAFEWVQDWYDPKFYRPDPSVNPTGPAKPVWMGGTGTYVDRLTVGEKRVLRGGSWIAAPQSITTTHRFWNHPINNCYGVGLGFRCALTAPAAIPDHLREAYIDTYVSMGKEQWVEARGHLDRALSFDPANPELRELDALLNAKMKTGKRS